MRRIITLAFLALVSFAALANAQTQTVTRSMVLTLTPFLSCVGTRDMDWGSHRRTDGTVVSGPLAYLEWTCDTDPNASINISFPGLPAAMINPVATGLTVPLTYGASSAYADQNGVAFDPASGLSGDIVPTGHVVITLGRGGRNNTPDEFVRADVSNASPAGGGHYSAVITLTVSSN
jgi:hypothetical protein